MEEEVDGDVGEIIGRKEEGRGNLNLSIYVDFRSSDLRLRRELRILRIM